MGGNYEKGLYNQLMEVMARLDAVEEDLHVEKIEHKNDVDRLNAKIDCLTEENRLLKDDNARLKSIINNDSSNTSLPPFTDQKGGKPANTYNSCQHTGRKAGGQKGHKGTTLTKEEVEDWASCGDSVEHLKELLSHNHFIGAFDKANHMVGFSSMNKDGYLHSMFVHKDWQGKGVATQLLSEVERIAKQLGVVEITSEVSLTARPFFEKKGYEIVKIQKYRANKLELTNFIMRRKFL